MTNRKICSLLAGVTFSTFSLSSQALLLVEQFDDFWNTDVNELMDHADNNAPSASGLYGLIDFTDDPSGFVGDIPGSNPWPSAEAAGVRGTSNPLNQTFFAKITGEFFVNSAANYYFQTYNDDGVFVFIDGDLIINDPNLHPEARFEGTKSLGVGSHNVELYFFENTGEASLEFSVSDTGLNFSHFNDPNGPVSLVRQNPDPNPVPLPAPLALVAISLAGLLISKRSSK